MTLGSEYWKTRDGEWIEEQWRTKNHPHRKQIINILKKLRPWGSLLEIGCGSGVNLANIRKKFGNVNLAGVDANKQAIDYGRKKLPDIQFDCGVIEDWQVGNYDIVLADAVLLYVAPAYILGVMEKIRKAKKAIILCEWYDNDRLGVVREDHWARNYPLLFKEFGWECRQKKIIWPESRTWEKIGKLFVAHPSYGYYGKSAYNVIKIEQDEMVIK